MARIKLTPSDLTGLDALRELGSDAFRSIAQALTDGAVLLRPSELERVLASHTSASKAATDILVKLAFLARLRDKAPGSVVGDATESVREIWSPEEFSAWQAKGSDVLSLVGHDRVQVLAKAIGLKYAHASIYHRVQIITDVRPVFDVERQDPVAAVISHTLQVTFSRDGENQTATMTLDNRDVEQLIDQASAAKRKASTLLEFLRRRLGAEIRVEEAGGVGGDE